MPVVIVKDDDGPRCDAPHIRIDPGVKIHPYTCDVIHTSAGWRALPSIQHAVQPAADWTLLVPLMWRVLLLRLR